jgi:hypothetical protein
MKTTEYLLAAGLACAALGAGLCQFVLIGLIGLGLFVVAFVLLLMAGFTAYLAQSTEHVPGWQKGAGLVLYVAGIVLLLVVAGYASSLAFNREIIKLMPDGVIHLPGMPAGGAPRILDWGLVGLASLVPALLVALGLRYGANWSWNRCTRWATAGLCVSPAAVLIFWSLHPIFPISA